MQTKSSVSVGTLGVVTAAVLALLGAYVMGAGSAGGTPAAADPAAAQPTAADTRTIAMTGTGEVTGVPDQLTFQVSVNKKAGDVSTALAATNRTMRQVLAALRQAGVARKDVQTTGLSIRPDYYYGSNSPPVLTGYVVNQSASVLVRDLKSSGSALSAAVRAGGDAVRVNGLSLKIGDRDALMTKARSAAVSAAEAKAKQYADATGQTLGAVVSLREVRATPPPVYGLRTPAMATLDAVKGSVPIRAGSENLKVTVSIVWQLG